MNSISDKTNTQESRQDFCYHTHTRRCAHAEDVEDEKYVEEAIKGGIKRIAFTDHMPTPTPDYIKTTRKVRMYMTELKSYLDSIADLKEKYKGQIDIESGFEFEYSDDLEEHLMYLKSITDKMILGQHFVVDKDGNKHVLKGEIASDDMLDLYAEAIITAIDKGLPDIIAHPDRFMVSRESFGEKEEQISRLICRKVIEAGIPLEINMGEPLDHLKDSDMTADELRSKVAYPAREFWKIVLDESKEAVKNGREPVKVVYGKDAHSSDRMSETKDYELVDKIIGTDILKQLYFVKSDLKTYNGELVRQFDLDDKGNNNTYAILTSEAIKGFARDLEVASEKGNSEAAIASMNRAKETKHISL